MARMLAIVVELFVGLPGWLPEPEASNHDCEGCSVWGAVARTLSLFWAWKVARQASSSTNSFTVVSREGRGLRLRS